MKLSAVCITSAYIFLLSGVAFNILYSIDGGDPSTFYAVCAVAMAALAIYHRKTNG